MAAHATHFVIYINKISRNLSLWLPELLFEQSSGGMKVTITLHDASVI